MANMCQSCGMPLSKDPEGGGSEADGSKSTMYCSYCYKNGSFVDNCTDVKEYQAYVKKILRDKGHNRFIAWLFTVNIPNLKRWKK